MAVSRSVWVSASSDSRSLMDLSFSVIVADRSLMLSFNPAMRLSVASYNFIKSARGITLNCFQLFDLARSESNCESIVCALVVSAVMKNNKPKTFLIFPI
jgi:hypothetical protein